MDLDQLIRNADPAQHLEIDPPDPRSITERPSTRARRSTGIAVVLSIAVVIAVVAVLLGVRGQRTPQQPAVPTHKSTQPQWLSALGARFSILHSPATRPPRGIGVVFKQLLPAGPEADLSLAHRVTLPEGTVWIVPSPSEVCIAFVRPGDRRPAGGGCSTTVQAQKTGVRLTAGIKHLDRAWAVGLVPDAISAVEVHHTTGPPVTAPVSHNAFVAAVSPRITGTTLIHNRGSSSPPASAQALVAKLGILRQPQTSGARAFNHTRTGRPPRATIGPQLTRLVRLPHGIRVWLYVVTGPAPGERGVGISERGGAAGQQAGFGECCTSLAELQRPGTPGPLTSSSAPHPHQVYVEVVPDGVARVRWTFPRRPSVGRTPHTSGLGPFAHPLTTTVIVHHNIAGAILPDRWAAKTVVWYDASGRIIANHTSH